MTKESRWAPPEGMEERARAIFDKKPEARVQSPHDELASKYDAESQALDIEDLMTSKMGKQCMAIASTTFEATVDAWIDKRFADWGEERTDEGIDRIGAKKQSELHLELNQLRIALLIAMGYEFGQLHLRSQPEDMARHNAREFADAVCTGINIGWQHKTYKERLGDEMEDLVDRLKEKYGDDPAQMTDAQRAAAAREVMEALGDKTDG